MYMHMYSRNVGNKGRGRGSGKRKCMRKRVSRVAILSVVEIAAENYLERKSGWVGIMLARLCTT